MLRPPSPPAPRGRPVQAHLRAGLALLLSLAPLPAGRGLPLAAEAQVDLRSHIGEVFYVLNPLAVRTRGGGNLPVDLPRGLGVRLIQWSQERVVLEIGPAGTGALGALGVRRMPRYTVATTQAAAALLTEAGWTRAREQGIARVRARWPDLSPSDAESIFMRRPFIGMTVEQAEEALGDMILSRRDGTGAAEATWTVGWRPRTAELRAYTEDRERGRKEASFDEHLEKKVRTVLTFREGILVAMATPSGEFEAALSP